MPNCKICDRPVLAGPVMHSECLEKLVAETAEQFCDSFQDLHFVMADGGTCKVCAHKCAFGTGVCVPMWRGEEASRPEEDDR